MILGPGHDGELSDNDVSFKQIWSVSILFTKVDSNFFEPHLFVL